MLLPLEVPHVFIDTSLICPRSSKSSSVPARVHVRRTQRRAAQFVADYCLAMDLRRDQHIHIHTHMQCVYVYIYIHMLHVLNSTQELLKPSDAVAAHCSPLNETRISEYLVSTWAQAVRRKNFQDPDSQSVGDQCSETAIPSKALVKREIRILLEAMLWRTSFPGFLFSPSLRHFRRHGTG